MTFNHDHTKFYDEETETWSLVHPRIVEEQKRSADDFLAALNKKLKIIQSKEKGLYR